MVERPAESKIPIRMTQDMHRQLRIRCAALDVTKQDFVVRSLDQGLTGEAGDGGQFRLTAKGRSLALASFSPPLKRSTAERKICELMERVRLVNRGPYYLYAVVRVLLFGSMLGESNRLGGVDLVIDSFHTSNDEVLKGIMTEQLFP